MVVITALTGKKSIFRGKIYVQYSSGFYADLRFSYLLLDHNYSPYCLHFFPDDVKEVLPVSRGCLVMAPDATSIDFEHCSLSVNSCTS